jgi:hypothetical protein
MGVQFFSGAAGQFFQIDQILCATRGAFVADQRFPADHVQLDPVKHCGDTRSPNLLEGDTADRGHQVNSVRRYPKLNNLVLGAEVFQGDPQAAKSELLQSGHHMASVLAAWPDKKVDVTGIPGESVPGDRQRSHNDKLNFVRA